MPSSHSLVSRSVFGLVLLVPIATSVARADLTLCPGAVSRGFTLTTFASGFPNTSGYGPFGIAFRKDGQVLVTNYIGSKIYLLPSHADNQTGPYTEIANYGPGPNDAKGLAQIQVGNQWKYYLSQTTAGRLIEIDENGTLVQTIVSMPVAAGIAPYPAGGAVGALTGHLFVTDITNIWDVDPVAKTKTLFASPGGSADGLSFNVDGSLIYVALDASDVVQAYDVSTGLLTWQSPVQPGHPDGTAIGLGTLTGYIYSNFNNGEVWEFGVPGGPHAGEVNCIASGGSRGDWIAADPNAYCPGGYPSLLLTQTDRIMRLDPPGGGFFGPPTSATEPVTPCSGAASWSNYGSGWPGTNGVPSFVAGADPALCTTVTLSLANSLGATTTAALFIGITQIDQPTIYGGHLLVAPNSIFLFAVPAAGLALPGALPCDGSLCGLPVYLQALEVDAGASKGISFTRGMQLVLGG